MVLRWSHTECAGERPWGAAERICLSALHCQTGTTEHLLHLENARWLHSELFVNNVSVEVRQREPQRDWAGRWGSVTIFIWFVFLPCCLFYLSHCTFSVWVKMWADSNHQVARQRYKCAGMQRFGFGLCLKGRLPNSLLFHPLPSSSPSST